MLHIATLVLFAGSMIPAATLPPSDHELTLMCESFTATILQVWQKRLSLEGWRISVVMAREIDLHPKTLGNVHWDPSTKTAIIRVLDPSGYHMPLPVMLRDMEDTVVHELVHLTLAPVVVDLERTEANRHELENTVNHVTAALLRAQGSQ